MQAGSSRKRHQVADAKEKVESHALKEDVIQSMAKVLTSGPGLMSLGWH